MIVIVLTAYDTQENDEETLFRVFKTVSKATSVANKDYRSRTEHNLYTVRELPFEPRGKNEYGCKIGRFEYVMRIVELET